MYNTIKSDLKIAMKEKNTPVKNILRVILGQLENISKNPTDNDTISVIKNNIKQNTIMNSEESLFENTIIEKYLPKKLDKDELISIVDTFIADNSLSGMKAMGVIMKHFTTTYKGRYDGKELSTIVKQKLV